LLLQRVEAEQTRLLIITHNTKFTNTSLLLIIISKQQGIIMWEIFITWTIIFSFYEDQIYSKHNNKFTQ